jgi:hypothetical protein
MLTSYLCHSAADRLYTVTDDFIVDVYHNGVKVADGRRTLLNEVFGATVERVDIELRPGDWLVFNVVNNRLRWDGCSYFGVTARGERGVAFVTEPDTGRWSCCDDPDKVSQFLRDREYLTWDRAVTIAKPWGEGDGLMTQVANVWAGKPVWGRGRNTWIKYVVC